MPNASRVRELLAKAEKSGLETDEQQEIQKFEKEFHTEYNALCERHGLQIIARPAVNIGLSPFYPPKQDAGLTSAPEIIDQAK